MIHTNKFMLLFKNIHLFMSVNRIMSIFISLLYAFACRRMFSSVNKCISRKINDASLLKIIITINILKKSY